MVTPNYNYFVYCASDLGMFKNLLRDQVDQWTKRDSDQKRTRGAQKKSWDEQLYFILTIRLKLYLSNAIGAG